MFRATWLAALVLIGLSLSASTAAAQEETLTGQLREAVTVARAGLVVTVGGDTVGLEKSVLKADGVMVLVLDDGTVVVLTPSYTNSRPYDLLKDAATSRVEVRGTRYMAGAVPVFMVESARVIQ